MESVLVLNSTYEALGSALNREPGITVDFRR
jgi:hypothetical protein